MDGPVRQFDAGYCLLPVVAVGGTAIGWGRNLPQCPQMWTLIVVSTNVDTILYLYLRLLTLLVLHHTRSSITIEVISRDSYCFPTRFFVSFSVYFSVQRLKPIKRTYCYLQMQPVWNNLYMYNCTPSIYETFIDMFLSDVSFCVIFLCFFLGIRLLRNLLQQQGTCDMNVNQTLLLPRENYRVKQLLDGC